MSPITSDATGSDHRDSLRVAVGSNHVEKVHFFQPVPFAERVLLVLFANVIQCSLDLLETFELRSGKDHAREKRKEKQ